MKPIHLLITIAAALLFTGCITQQRCADKYPPRIITETITETVTVYRDTTIYVHVPPVVVTDTLYVYIKDGLAQTKPSWLYAPFAESFAQVVDGRLQHTLNQKDTLLNRVIKNAIREGKQTKYITTTVEVEVPAQITWWQQTLMRLGWLAIAMLVAGVGWLVLKIKP